MTSKRKRLAPLRDMELSRREQVDRFIRDAVEAAGYNCTRTLWRARWPWQVDVWWRVTPQHDEHVERTTAFTYAGIRRKVWRSWAA